MKKCRQNNAPSNKFALSSKSFLNLRSLLQFVLPMKNIPVCIECSKSLSEGVHDFSLEVFGHPLCMRHQAIIMESGVSEQATYLYLALRSRDLPFVLSYFDGFKNVDMAIPGKLHIEVSGKHTSIGKIAMNTASPSVLSSKFNIPTIVIPDCLFQNPGTFHKTVDELAKYCLPLISQSSFYHLAHSLSRAQLQ